MELPLVKELVVIFCLSSFVIYGCHRIKVPPIVGFLLTGMVCGPYGLKLISAVHEVELLAEVGVVLLMFSIGMELSIGDLIRLRKPVFLGGAAQVGLTIAATVPLMLLFDNQINHAIFVGCLVALSSTAIILNVLQQSGQMDSPHGRVTLSILIFQDLAIVPMMLAVPLLAGADADARESTLSLLLSGLKTLGIIVALFLGARKLVPLGLAMIVRTRSRELFLIATLGICLSIAWLTSSLGLSLSLGAFMAGLIMSESEYSHNALEGIIPFKDVFTSLFFTSVGMLLNLSFFATHLLQVALIIVALVSLKALVVTFVTLILGYPLRPALITGLALCQIGEFSFVLAKEGQKYHLLFDDHYQIFLAASIMTMASAPFLLAGAQRFAYAVTRMSLIVRLFGRHRLREVQARIPDGELSDHLIIIGFGVGGKYLARTAKVAGISYTILEMNPDTVRAYAAKGEPIAYGDATSPVSLRALGVTRARVLAIVISDPVATRSVIKTARHIAPGLHIVARTRFLGEIQALHELGASDIIPEELEASVEIFARVLSRYLVPRADIERFVSDIRSESYAMLRSLDLPGTTLGALRKQIPHLNVTAVTVEPLSHMDGLSLLQAQLRQKTGVSIMAVLRGEELFPNPDGTFHMLAGDVAYIFATSEAINEAAQLFTADANG
jgi:CPA2 family monovalent cation:H+ antiporter-2